MNLAHRKQKDDLERHMPRSDSFSKTRKQRSGLMPLFVHHNWRQIMAVVAVFGLLHILLVSKVTTDSLVSPSSGSRHLSIRHPLKVPVPHDQPKKSSPWYPLALSAKKAEQGILDFFHGDKRSLDNGIPVGGTEESTLILAQRLARKISNCRDLNRVKEQHEDDCTLKVAFIGSAQMVGKDMFFNESFPFKAEQRLRPIAEEAGLKLQVMNHAQDNDISREGPQKSHMCVANLVGKSVDVIAWDLDDGMKGDPPAQFEAFVRWALASNPAMILINRGGPHERSRRGKRTAVIDIGVGHNAEIWEDDLDLLPDQREDDYRGSDSWKTRWEEERNSFWGELVQQYSPFVDFAAVDPVGSIWYLDHLQDFSNAAFDAGKALPLLDCGKEHPGPCNQIPPFIANKLSAMQVSLENFPEEAIGGGEVCSSFTGCRHFWYGGKRSHELRGELNALPIVRALRNAAVILSNPTEFQALKEISASSKKRVLSIKSLPPPLHCSEMFCSRTPTCVTSYLPNLGPDLEDAILDNGGEEEGENESIDKDDDVIVEKNDDVDKEDEEKEDEEEDKTPARAKANPRMGAAHFADDPEWIVQNLEKRFAPLGYIDRKYAYRLSVGDGTKKLRPGANPNVTDGELEPYEPEDASMADVVFTANGDGPVVLCEPPCMEDHCSPRRRMPMIGHVTLELDGVPLELPEEKPPVEVGGALCKLIANEVSEGNHILRITTNVKYPFHVWFSHIIAFA